MEIRRASKAISLVLISTMAVFFGFKSCTDADDYAPNQPSTQSSGGRGYYGHPYYGYHYWSSGARSVSPSGSSSGSHISGTSRGGFGSSGHFAGS